MRSGPPPAARCWRRNTWRGGATASAGSTGRARSRAGSCPAGGGGGPRARGPPGPPADAPALIELNVKFWASTDVALAVGVDFPGDLVALLEGRALAAKAEPGKKVRFSWPLGGDLWHGLFRPASLPAVLLDTFSPGVAHSFRLADPVPHLYELAQWARSAPGAWREQRVTR